MPAHAPPLDAAAGDVARTDDDVGAFVERAHELGQVFGIVREVGVHLEEALVAFGEALLERLHVRHRAGKLGLGTAYLEGFQWALAQNYDVVFEMDTDLSHDPRYVPEFIRAIEAGADVVIGSRNIPGGGVEGWGPGRHFVSKGGSVYARTILGLDVRDLTSGYKAFTRDALQRIDLGGVKSNGYSFQIELTYRAVLRGMRVAEVPILFVDRRAGASKMSRKIFAEAVVMVWKLRLDAMRGRM